MNILFLTYNRKPIDGWSVVGYNIIKNLGEYNFQVFSSENRKSFLFGKKNLKSEFFDKLKYFGLIFDFINILINIKNKPDIIHCNVEYYAPIAMFLSKIYKVPYTITAHGTYGVVLPTKYNIYNKAFKNASKVITVSNFTKKRMIEEGIGANYEVILNGVDKAKFRIDPKIEKEDTISFVGNLKPRKGLFFLLNCMIEVNKINPNIKIIVIGNIDFNSKSYQDTIEFIKKNKLKVEFTGKVTEDELILNYQKSKLNILPSQTEPYFFEGFGLVHLEANSCGTLTIGTKNSGNEDAILKNNGYLVNYGNIEDLSKKIIQVFESKEYPNIDINAIRDWKDVALEYKQIFLSLKN